ncbi:MAG TPA: glycerophosphodiester phosphodiesterase family protein [Microbacteriaceae bacterium]|nr:glycerophosphodiester phosphodiesterase family protein [Microbacteriaceae bacterium]
MPTAPSRPPRVLAHRGLATETLENSLAAFRAAAALGVEVIETDAHETADGVAVLWHDPDLRRFNGHPTRVRDLTWLELSELEADGERIPSLAEALYALPNARFNIDLKTWDVVEPVLSAIRAAGAIERVRLASFSNRRRLRARALLPGVATSPGMSAVLLLVLSRSLPRRFRNALWRRALAGADAIQVPERGYGIHIVTEAMIRTAHELGVELHVWTVNAPGDIRRLLALGVDGIVTDRSDIACAVVAGWGSPQL